MARQAHLQTLSQNPKILGVIALGYPFHPQGIGQHGESNEPIDQPSYKHLGKR